MAYYRSPGLNLPIFDYRPGRGQECPKAVLRSFSGVLQTDGYKAYDAVARDAGGRIELAGCWAHARRKFVEAEKSDPKAVAVILRGIGHLYAIENAIRPVAVGRKNYLLAGSHESAEIIAQLYSFMAACKIHDVNPTEWLADVLVQLPGAKPSDYPKLFPSNWTKTVHPREGLYEEFFLDDLEAKTTTEAE